MQRGSAVAPLVAVAPWLARGLSEEEELHARNTRVRLRRIPVGPWEAENEGLVGLLILSGRVTRSVYVDEVEHHNLELLGDKDLLRPWTYAGEIESIPASVDWCIIQEVEAAELGESYLRLIARWPQIAVNLLDAAIERTRTLSYFMTARHLPRLESRLLVTFWHLADRWGHVSADGVVLDLPNVTHEMLARVVAARRPSVTTALRHLQELGLLQVRGRGSWVLIGDPVEALHVARQSDGVRAV